MAIQIESDVYCLLEVFDVCPFRKRFIDGVFSSLANNSELVAVCLVSFSFGSKINL